MIMIFTFIFCCKQAIISLIFSHEVCAALCKLLLKACCTNKVYYFYYFVQVIRGVISIKLCLYIPVCFSRPFNLNTLISLLLYLWTFCHRTLRSQGTSAMEFRTSGQESET